MQTASSLKDDLRPSSKTTSVSDLEDDEYLLCALTTFFFLYYFFFRTFTPGFIR